MKQEETFGHLSMRQVQYLAELKNLNQTGKKRGIVAAVAGICGVSHVAVSRFLKECYDNGYLTENYAFTELGQRFFHWHEKLLGDTIEYLRRNHIPEDQLEERARQLYEHVDYDTLTMITRSDRQIRKMISAEPEGDEIRNFPKNLEKGVFPVRIAVFQMQPGHQMTLSMAHRGFEPVAMLKSNNRGCYLELSIREMHAHSRMNGQDMSGHLSVLRYVENGNFFEAPIRKGKVTLPLDACHFHKNSRGRVKGSISITVACSVGEAHMPERTAQLVFWM